MSSRATSRSTKSKGAFNTCLVTSRWSSAKGAVKLLVECILHPIVRVKTRKRRLPHFRVMSQEESGYDVSEFGQSSDGFGRKESVIQKPQLDPKGRTTPSKRY